ncbi:MAG: response regulator [Patescibacteria group bacterium]
MAQGKKTILLVEDDVFIRRSYKDGFEIAGFEVDEASDGKEALAKMKARKPDLVLLDLIMPVMDGFEALAEIRKNDQWKKIPVIIFSNLGQESDFKVVKDLGATDYFIKSKWSMKEVIDKLRKYLEEKA